MYNCCSQLSFFCQEGWEGNSGFSFKNVDITFKYQMFSQGIRESWCENPHIPCASNIVWIYFVCEYGNISQLKYSMVSTVQLEHPQYLLYIFRTRKWYFSLFIDEEPCHRTQRIWIAKIKTVAYVFCGVRYCSKYSTVLHLTEHEEPAGMVLTQEWHPWVKTPSFCSVNTAEPTAGLKISFQKCSALQKKVGGN